jgi:hypothetical protein
MTDQGRPRPARLSACATASSRLALRSDLALQRAVDQAPRARPGIGGTSATVEAGGVRVFVKQVPVTGRELRPGNVRSTANLFGLPGFYQYGLGSAGFGAWRELAELVDGTIAAQPKYAWWFAGVGWAVENHGVDPDVEVTIAPHDWAAGRDPQLDTAVRLALQALEQRTPAAPPAV